MPANALRPAVCAALLAGLAAAAPASADVVTATGSAAAIQGSVDAFRSAVGTLNANTPGSAVTGRREINWDGVPAGSSDPSALPGDFFNVTSPRGVMLSTVGGGGLRVSNLTTLRFSDRNAGYAAGFGTFSPQKLFSPLGSVATDVAFRVPGAATSATTSAFGLVLTDVDLNGVSSVELFDAQGASLGSSLVPAAPGNGQLSFVGITLPGGQRAARARILSGNVGLGSADGGLSDAVALDDFVYGEPQAIGAVTAADPAPVSESSGSVTLTLSRSGTAGAGSVAYATSDGTAKAGSDYVATSGRARFADGEATASVQVPLVYDPNAEQIESFGLALAAPEGAFALGNPSAATVTIEDVALKGAPPQVVVQTVPATLPPDRTKPRVTTLVASTAAVRRSALRRGVRVVVGSSEAGRRTARLRAGSRTLATLPSRSIPAGATALLPKLSAKALKKLPSRAKSLVLEVTVTDAAGNAGRATRRLRLKR